MEVNYEIWSGLMEVSWEFPSNNNGCMDGLND